MLRSLMIILVVGALVASAHPASMFPRRRRLSLEQDTVATVDCSDREAVKNVLKTHANFRCVYPNWNRPSGFTAPTESKLFPDGLESASLVRSSNRKCQQGFLFSPDVNLCLAAHKPLHPIAALQSDNLVVENPIMEIMSFSDGPNSADDCPRGTLFNSELRICSEMSSSGESRPLSTLNLVREDEAPAALEIRSFAGEAQSAADCKPGEVFAMDVNLCVDMNARPPRSPGLQSASLVRSRVQPTNPPLVFRKDCRRDQIYLSEIGICAKRPNGKPRKPLPGSLVRATPAPVAPRVAVREKTTCAPGEMFNPSISSCVLMSSSQIQPTPPSSESLVKEPVHLELESSQSTITAEDCRRLGKIFVGELGICM